MDFEFVDIDEPNEIKIETEELAASDLIVYDGIFVDKGGVISDDHGKDPRALKNGDSERHQEARDLSKYDVKQGNAEARKDTGSQKAANKVADMADEGIDATFDGGQKPTYPLEKRKQLADDIAAEEKEVKCKRGKQEHVTIPNCKQRQAEQRTKKKGLVTRYKCEQCDYTTSTNHEFRQHKRSNHLDFYYQCPHCNHSADKLDAYVKHYDEKHGGGDKAEEASAEGNFECTTSGCGYRTRDRLDLPKHYMQQHRHPMHVCADCGYRTRRRQLHLSHVRNEHAREPKLKCARRAGCSFKTDQQEHLDTHIQKVHQKQMERCLKCSYACETVEELEKHTKAEHSTKCA